MDAHHQHKHTRELGGGLVPPPSHRQQRRGMAAGIARERTAVTTRLWNARMEAAKAAGVMDQCSGTQAQDQLVSKPPHRTSVRYGFEHDEGLVEAYRNPWNSVRIGRIVEDLDSLAGNIAFQHCDDANPNTRPQLLVTASVDRVNLVRPLALSEDLVLSGAVAWVGRSSMVIRMEAWPADHPDAPRDYTVGGEKENVKKVKEVVGSIPDASGGKGAEEEEAATAARTYEPGPSLSADFTFVARDAVTNRGAPVNPLVPRTDAEKALFNATAARVEAKKRRMKVRAAGDAGLSEELASAKKRFIEEQMRASRMLHELPALAPSDVIACDATRTENMFVAQPQQRNLSGRIFGGFLLRRAFELAFATTYVFGGARPVFKQVSDMDFLRPVDIGDLLRFRARVLRSAEGKCGRPCVDVEVEALVTKPEALTSDISNTFMFQFYVGSKKNNQSATTTTEEEEVGGEDEQSPTKNAPPHAATASPRRVLPRTREEAAHVWERCERPRLDVELQQE